MYINTWLQTCDRYIRICTYIYTYITVICFTKQHNTCTTPHKQYCMVRSIHSTHLLESRLLSIVHPTYHELVSVAMATTPVWKLRAAHLCRLTTSKDTRCWDAEWILQDFGRLDSKLPQISHHYCMPRLLRKELFPLDSACQCTQTVFDFWCWFSSTTSNLSVVLSWCKRCNVWMSRSVGDKVTIEAVPLLSTQTLHPSKTAAPVLSGSFNNFIVNWKFREAHIRIAMLILSVDSIVCPAGTIGSGGFPQTNMFCLVHGSIPETNEVGKVREKICRNNIHR